MRSPAGAAPVNSSRDALVSAMTRAVARGPSGAKLSATRGAPDTNTRRPRVTVPSGALNRAPTNPPRVSARRRAVSSATAVFAAARNRPIASR